MYSALKMIKQADSDSILFAHRASQLLQSEQNEEALILCEKGVKRFPFYAEGHFMLARCYQAMNEPDMAIEEFERTLSFNPGHLKALKALAYLFYKSKKPEQGNKILLSMALYDPLNSELMDFLKSENLIHPEMDEYDESGQKEPENETEPESESILEEPEKSETQDAAVEEEPTELVEETEVNLAAISSDQQQGGVGKEDGTDEKASFEKIVEAPPLDSDVIEELFPEEEPAVELDPIQDVPDETPRHFADLEASETEQENFERNNISEHLEETDTFHKPLDLDQFDNTEDDFSTLIEGYFEDPSNEVVTTEENEAVELPESEEPAEERPLLDTTVIFRENRGAGSEILATEEDDLVPALEDFNKVADEIEHMTEEEPAIIEQDMDEELPQVESVEALTEKEETKIKTPVSEKDSMPEPQPEPLNIDMVRNFDEEEVNIEDILQNPSLLTPTFGEILIAQKKFKDAREVFMALSRREPENDRFLKKIDFLNKIVAIQK